MKKFLHQFIFSFYLLVSVFVFSQSEKYSWQFSIGFNAIDTYPTAAVGQGALFEEFVNYDHWNIAPYPSQIAFTNYLGSGFSYGLRLSQNSITKYGNRTVDSDLFVDLDAIVKYDLGVLFKINRFAPFLETGGGYAFFGDISAGYFNLGLGIEYALGKEKKTVLFVESLFRNTGETYGTKHFQHSAGIAFRFGTIKDRDFDGIDDIKDLCPDIPGLEATKGCPDSDGDGIQDNEDDCPNTYGLEKFRGCPDSDEDGIQDNEDNCPNTFGLEKFNGCPDTDEDEIPDHEDACPYIVGLPDLNGCPDSDGDGVIDSLDECPDSAGKSSNKGCPEPTDEIIKKLNDLARTIYFETNSRKLSSSTKFKIDEVFGLLEKYPNYKVIVEGHTDNSAKAEYNMQLSIDRAQATMDYLVSKGISRSRISVKGYGETSPIESNSTAKGRLMNRRVEFKLTKN